jgi:hypothetical protein
MNLIKKPTGNEIAMLARTTKDGIVKTETTNRNPVEIETRIGSLARTVIMTGKIEKETTDRKRKNIMTARTETSIGVERTSQENVTSTTTKIGEMMDEIAIEMATKTERIIKEIKIIEVTVTDMMRHEKTTRNAITILAPDDIQIDSHFAI